jgi:hypothetical protein
VEGQQQEQPKKLKKPKSYDDLYPGRFLKAGNFNGKKVTLTIADYRREELEGEDGKKAVKAIVCFKETPMELVACKTNGLCIREMFGVSLPGWIGKKVILFPSTWAGKPAIRVWGSPDITKEQTLTVKLPRRKPFKMTLHTNAGDDAGTATSGDYDDSNDAGTDAGPPSDRQPGDDADDAAGVIT